MPWESAVSEGLRGIICLFLLTAGVDPRLRMKSCGGSSFQAWLEHTCVLHLRPELSYNLEAGSQRQEKEKEKQGEGVGVGWRVGWGGERRK